MSCAHTMTLQKITLPSISDCTYDVEFGVSILAINLKTREVEYVIDWLEYNDGGKCRARARAGGEWWKRGSDTMINVIAFKYCNQISDGLLALQIEIEYNDAEDNPYPNW